MTKVNIPTIKLNNGKEIPALGYGTWLGVDDECNLLYADFPKLTEALSHAIDIGYRHIDTAHLYRVEPEVGQVINKKIKDGVVKREDLFVTSKVWQHYHRESDVEVSVRGSLRRLNLDYLDLILMHWPMSISQEGVDEKIDYLETWRGFETVLKLGLVKAIGVSNFNEKQLKRLLANCNVVPVCNQIEINLNLGQKSLVELCQSNKIVVVAYTPFGTMVPSRLVPNSPEPKLNNPIMVGLAKKYGKTVTQIALRYLYERGIVAIPKTITKSRILENASIFDIKLDEADFDTLSKFDNGYRTVRPVFWKEFQNYPFDIQEEDVCIYTTNKVPGTKVEIPKTFLVWKNGANQDID